MFSIRHRNGSFLDQNAVINQNLDEPKSRAMKLPRLRDEVS